MKRKILFLCFTFMFIFMQAKEINFKVLWFPQSQFAGYIMAKEKGFFKARNLNVNLLFSTGNDNLIQELKDNKIQYCSAWLSEAISKNEDDELNLFMQVLQKSSLMIISRKSANIKIPSDLNGKKVRLWGGNFAVPFQAFINKYHLNFQEIKGGYTINVFLSGACDATCGMFYNEYNKIYLSGINYDEMNTIFFSDDNDLNFPEDGIYVKKSYYKNNKKEVLEMKNAIIDGWEYARKNKEETVQTVLKYCNNWNLKTNYAEQKWMLEKILNSIFSSNSFGKLKKSDYQKVQNELIHQNIIKNKIPFSDFYVGEK